MSAYEGWQDYRSSMGTPVRARELSYAEELWDGTSKKWFLGGDYELVLPNGMKMGMPEQDFHDHFEAVTCEEKNLPKVLPWKQKWARLIFSMTGGLFGSSKLRTLPSPQEYIDFIKRKHP